MKTLVRTLLYLALMVWIGAEVFFPVVAAITFQTLQPDTHMAGSIVGRLLRILHDLGFVCGVAAMALLALAPMFSIYKPRAVLFPMGLLLLMIALTAHSQFGIIPAMERDRIAAGGAIDAVDAANPSRVHFERLHKRSESIEGAVLLLGIGTVVLVALAESQGS